MRSTTDQLLRLVATMSAQEKRYFKLCASFYNKKSGNHCLRLFELTERRKPNNSRELAEIVQDEPFAGQVAYIKNQLTEQVLDSLASYNSDKRTLITLYRLIEHADVLVERGLYQHAGKVLERARKKAEATDQYPLLLELLARERALLFRHVTETFEADLAKIYARQLHILEMLQLIASYRQMADTMQIAASRYAVAPSTADRDSMNAIISALDAHGSERPLPFTARLAEYNIRGTHALLTGDAAAALEQFRDAVQLWQQHPLMIDEYPVQYLRYLQNYLNCLLDTNDSKEFAAVASEFRRRATATSETQFRFLKELWNIEFLFYLNRGDMEGAAGLIADIEQSLQASGEHIEPASFITLCHNCIVYYFLTGQYARCLAHINNLLGETRIDLKRDLLGFARVFSLIAHFELGNIDILDAQIRSARHYLKKLGAAGALEQTILKSIGALIGSSAGTRDIFKALRSRLIEILHTGGYEPSGLGEVLFWVESHLRRRPVQEVVANMVRKNGTADSRLLFPQESP